MLTFANMCDKISEYEYTYQAEKMDMQILRDRYDIKDQDKLNIYYQQNRQEKIDKQKQYYRQNRQERIEYQKKRYQQKKEYLRAYQRARYYEQKLKQLEKGE